MSVQRLPQNPPGAVGPLRVVVIDSSIDDAEQLRARLSSEPDIQVDIARSLDEGHDLIAAPRRVDAILVDQITWAAAGDDVVLAARQRQPGAAVLVLAGTTAGTEPPERDDLIAVERLSDADLRDRIATAVGTARSTCRRQTMVRWLEREARTDAFTGLLNRHAFDEQLLEACHESRRRRTPLTLIVADVCGTGLVNETYGHDAGDAMIRRAADAILLNIRSTDVAARIGGDDFVLLLNGCDLDAGRRVVRRVAHELERINSSLEDEPPISLSFGVASAIGCDADALLGAAEAQLMRAAPVRQRPPLAIRRRDEQEGPSVA